MALDYGLLSVVNEYSSTIRRMARSISAIPGVGNDLKRGAAHRVSRPIDYMRYAEFGAIVKHLKLKQGSLVLDAGGPQWLTFALAAKHPQVEFHYINFTDYELQPFEQIRALLKLDNMTISKEDIRKTSFPDDRYDEIFSISVLEHIFPEEGGDVLALNELKRVLKKDGHLIFTTPCKEKPNIVYVQGSVYERNGTADKQQFFAREYSASTLKALLSKANYESTEVSYISESPSLFSIDYLEWGPLRGTGLARLLLKFYRGIERYTGIPLEKLFASSKLSVVNTETPRLVNAIVKFHKQTAS